MKKIVIWGHKLHSHTHSYIHYAFFKSFNYIGVDTIWLNNDDDITSYDFDGALFITEGQVDKNIPINKKAYYVLHNCDLKLYESIAFLYLFNRIIFEFT